ncbi:F510_1955 family glycosylhydrolase [Frankia sp. Cr1]|uniref:F510_1955 family glycosylhydrolase n=1 Tax=Frankia sp. Cr1 TaxID=3073931 RepID=UPI002AD507D8|nr:hypothetical protein [Frankia sp. Cr1]
MAKRTSVMHRFGLAGQAAGVGRPARLRSWGLLVVGVAALAVAVAVAVVPGDRHDIAGGSEWAGGDLGMAHVHGLGVDPADGTLYAATHYGVFRVPASGPATRIAGRYQDTMGFAVVGPHHFLGSGHPDIRENRPVLLGLIESTDAGQTWRTLSLEGQADFHGLRVAHGQVYGYSSTTGQFMVSANRTDWDRRAALPIIDFAVSPTDPDLILATTGQGLTRSTDGGRTFIPLAAAPPLTLLSWPAPDVLFGAAATGAVLASTDGGTTWQQRGSLDGAPAAFTAVDATTVQAATHTGIYTSTDGGRTVRLRYRS